MINKFVVLISLILSIPLASAKHITGAGSSFAAPIFARWAADYHKLTGVEINFQPVGSSAGYNFIKNRKVDFAASDQPISAEKLAKDNLIQFPAIIGAIVAVVNIKGIAADQLVLSGPILTSIYTGRITRWNDAAIQALNPSIKLPNAAIAAVARSDGSGTTFLFSHYLSQFDQPAKNSLNNHATTNNGKNADTNRIVVSTNANLKAAVRAKGNQGIAASVRQMPNSIGYVEYAYAKRGKLAYTRLQNAAKQVVSPTLLAFRSAASHADWSTADGKILTNQPGDESWPIAGATFVLMHRQPETADSHPSVLNFFEWAFKNGEAAATSLGYVMLPNDVIKEIKKSQWQDILKE